MYASWQSPARLHVIPNKHQYMCTLTRGDIVEVFIYERLGQGLSTSVL
jgi:hypothetical protein